MIELNQKVSQRMQCQNELEIIPGTTYLFEEPGKLEQVAKLVTAMWFGKYFLIKDHA